MKEYDTLPSSRFVNYIANLSVQKAISAEKEAKQRALGEFKALPTKIGMSSNLFAPLLL